MLIVLIRYNRPILYQIELALAILPLGTPIWRRTLIQEIIVRIDRRLPYWTILDYSVLIWVGSPIDCATFASWAVIHSSKRPYRVLLWNLADSRSIDATTSSKEARHSSKSCMISCAKSIFILFLHVLDLLYLFFNSLLLWSKLVFFTVFWVLGDYVWLIL